jgi:hypothetical protein
LAKTNAAKAPVSKLKRSAIAKTPSRRTARLQSSPWYQKAAQSIGISDRLPNGATRSAASSALEPEQQRSR